MSLTTIILIILVICLVGGLPVHGYSRSWGYGPSGFVGALLVILLILLFLGKV